MYDLFIKFIHRGIWEIKEIAIFGNFHPDNIKSEKNNIAYLVENFAIFF